jgi:hypothetical protein
MAITDPSDEIQAYLTDYARQIIARQTIGDTAYQVVGFSTGRGGYDPTDPVHIVDVDTSQQALIDQVYPDVTGFASLISIDQPTPTLMVFNCRMGSTPNPGNADYGLGEVGIWAEITKSSVPGEVGTYFLYANGHLPIRAKTRRDTFLWRVLVQL